MRSRPGNLFQMHRDVQRALQLLIPKQVCDALTSWTAHAGYTDALEAG